MANHKNYRKFFTDPDYFNQQSADSQNDISSNSEDEPEVEYKLGDLSDYIFVEVDNPYDSEDNTPDFEEDPYPLPSVSTDGNDDAIQNLRNPLFSLISDSENEDGLSYPNNNPQPPNSDTPTPNNPKKSTNSNTINNDVKNQAIFQKTPKPHPQILSPESYENKIPNTPTPPKTNATEFKIQPLPGGVWRWDIIGRTNVDI